jgi:predicted amidophosphoribosyltransferase
MFIPHGLSHLVISAGVGRLLAEGKVMAPAPYRCPNCNTSIPGRLRRIARYCPYCGKGLVEEGYCEDCDIVYGPDISYCPIHGVKLGKIKKKK